MTPLILFCLGAAAFALLALGMERHGLQGSGHRLAAVPVPVWRAAGALGLGLMLVGSIAAWGPSIGPAAWFGLLSGSALAVVLLLTYSAIGLVSVAVAGSAAAAALAGLATM